MSQIKLQVLRKKIKQLVNEVLSENDRGQLEIAHLDEEEEQDSTVNDLFSGSSDEDAASGDDAGADEQPKTSKTGDDDAEHLESGDVTTDEIIEKLNAIRSGRSLRDDDVKAAMDEYIQSLSEAERTALFAFLKGMSQIITGEIPAADATDPGDDPADVEMSKDKTPSTGDKGKKTVHIKPNVIKKSSPKPAAASSTSGGAENTAAPAAVPIKPMKR